MMSNLKVFSRINRKGIIIDVYYIGRINRIFS